MNYLPHYERLIERAKTRQIEGYKERHHIIPRCMGGSDDPDNLVDLTAREHFVAHQLLVKIYPTNGKLIYACMMMKSPSKFHAGRVCNRSYGWIREKVAEQNRINTIGIKHPPRSEQWKERRRISMTGKKLSKPHREAISQRMKDREITDEFRKNMSKAASNRSPEHRKNLSIALTGRKISEESKQKMKDAAKKTLPVICPHCGKEGNPRAMYRWHFDNCKAIK